MGESSRQFHSLDAMVSTWENAESTHVQMLGTASQRVCHDTGQSVLG